ncbi:hypothetical protein F3Y22_tig00111427pilonHSYRG00532 [Hibiscus syriacus]|uniref:Chaperone DnaJ C-terminal domain-containing protein n=1 Tax=Hibiscus syriacus TaxID=106335 RepID=A0A6A2XRX9_HIBSY|nr:hypothetical protein F3Y22_tig00111427pilonHSYRG00532 [Hibiscus syriacus]
MQLQKLRLLWTNVVETAEGIKNLTIPCGVQPGDKVKLSRLGVPDINKPSVRGDHHFIVNVLIPKDISYKERALVEELASLKASKRSSPSDGVGMHEASKSIKASNERTSRVASLWNSIKAFLGKRQSQERFASITADTTSASLLRSHCKSDCILPSHDSKRRRLLSAPATKSVLSPANYNTIARSVLPSKLDDDLKGTPIAPCPSMVDLLLQESSIAKALYILNEDDVASTDTPSGRSLSVSSEALKHARSLLGEPDVGDLFGEMDEEFLHIEFTRRKNLTMCRQTRKTTFLRHFPHEGAMKTKF